MLEHSIEENEQRTRVKSREIQQRGQIASDLPKPEFGDNSLGPQLRKKLHQLINYRLFRTCWEVYEHIFHSQECIKSHFLFRSETVYIKHW